MSKLLSVLFLGVVVFVPGALGALLKDDKATEILKKAIKALGDEKTILADTQGEYETEGTIHLDEGKLKFTSKNIYCSEKVHSKFKGSFADTEFEIVLRSNGKQCQIKVNNEAIKQSDAELEDSLQSHLLNRVEQVAPILADKMSYKLEADSVKVREVEAYQFTVKSEKIKPVKVYFSKKDYRIIKMECAGIGVDKSPVTKEIYLSEYVKERGYYHPNRIEEYHDGKLVQEFNINNRRELDKVDPKLFEIED